MIGKAMRWLILSTVMAGLPYSGVLGGEALPPRAFARIGDHRFYHGPGIACAVLSPDGRRVASAATYPNPDHITDKEREAYDSTIVLWDAATGERLRELRVPQRGISCLAFSPNGKWLAADYRISPKKSAVVLFDVETGRLLRRLGDFEKRVALLQFSSDDKQLRVSEWLGPVSAWDITTGKQTRLWKAPPGVPRSNETEGAYAARGVFSPDGKVIVWEMRHLMEKGFMEKGFPEYGESLRVHDAATNKLLYQIKFQSLQESCNPEVVAFSADGKRFATGFGNNLTLWDTATGKKVPDREISKVIRRIALSPDGRRAAILGANFRLRLLDIETGKSSRDLLLGRGDTTTPLMFSADGKTLLFVPYSTLRLVDATTGEERGVPSHRTPVTPRFSADGRTLFTSCRERRGRWDISSANKPSLLSQEPRKASEVCLARSADDRLSLDYSDSGFRVRETATGRVVCKLEASIGSVLYDGSDAFFSPFSPDATRVLLWEFKGRLDSPNGPSILCRLYDTKTGKLSSEIKLANWVSGAVFSPNGRYIAWADDANAIHLHDATTGKAVRTLRSSRPMPKAEGHNAELLFSPDSEYVLEDRPQLPLRVFQVSSGREVTRFSANSKVVTRDSLSAVIRDSLSPRMAWSPDNRLLALAEEESGIVRLVEIASGKVRAEFAGHRHGVHGLAFSPDGQTLATGGEDNVVFLWDVTGVKTLAIVKKTPSEWWNDLASEDGKRAGVAITSLMRTPEQSIPLLRQRLHPAESLDKKHLARLLADLDGDAFETREAAGRELAQLGEQAELALRRALTNRPSLEVRRRIEDLLGKFPTPLPPETLRTLRAIEILEHIGTPAARQSLDALAKGTPDARETQEVKRALQRLAKRGEQRKIDRRRMEP